MVADFARAMGKYAKTIERDCAGSETVGGYDFGGDKGLTFNTAAHGLGRFFNNFKNPRATHVKKSNSLLLMFWCVYTSRKTLFWMQILNTFYGKSQQAATLHLNLKMRPVGVLLAAPFRTKRKFF